MSSKCMHICENGHTFEKPGDKCYRKVAPRHCSNKGHNNSECSCDECCPDCGSLFFEEVTDDEQS